MSFFGAAELGKRLPSSSPVLTNSKLFQKYYRKARKARKVHMEESFFATSMEALRLVAQVPGSLSLLPLISDTAETVVVLPVPVKDRGKSSSLMRGFFQ
jgi:hypothetical protein